MIAITQIKEDRERDTAAQQLVQLMRSEVQEEILNALYNLEKIAESQTIPTSIRVSAIETLSEHIFPNYNINYIIVEDKGPPVEITRAIKRTVNKLKKKLCSNKKKILKVTSFYTLIPFHYGSMGLNVD